MGRWNYRGVLLGVQCAGVPGLGFHVQTGWRPIFEPGYFQGAFEKFDEKPRLGIGGGVLYHVDKGERVLERHPMFHVRGGCKVSGGMLGCHRRALGRAGV